MEMNDEQLLRSVCKFPELWNIFHENYHKRGVSRNCWLSVSKTVDIPPEDCKKRLKALREKYYREKKKEDDAARHGNALTTSWPYMSFFQYMLTNRKKEKGRQRLPDEDSDSDECQSISQDASDPLQAQNDVYFKRDLFETPTPSEEPSQPDLKRLKTELNDSDEQLQISMASSCPPTDKCSAFCNYLNTELQSFPIWDADLFMDKIIEELLTFKRNRRNHHHD